MSPRSTMHLPLRRIWHGGTTLLYENIVLRSGSNSHDYYCTEPTDADAREMHTDGNIVLSWCVGDGCLFRRASERRLHQKAYVYLACAQRKGNGHQRHPCDHCVACVVSGDCGALSTTSKRR